MVHRHHVDYALVDREPQSVQNREPDKFIHKRGEIEAWERNASAKQDQKPGVVIVLDQVRAKRHEEHVDSDGDREQIGHDAIIFWDAEVRLNVGGDDACNVDTSREDHVDHSTNHR